MTGTVVVIEAVNTTQDQEAAIMVLIKEDMTTEVVTRDITTALTMNEIIDL
ncbi:hypothetical protein D3C80_1941470 [compost metagenome]